MDYEEYKKLKKQIADEYERELAALEMVWKRFQSLNSPSRKSISSANGDAAHAPPIAKSIRTAIKDFKSDFSADDVQQALIDHGFVKSDEVNRLSITNALHRLYRRKEIEVVTRGQGRKGSIYRLNPLGDLK
jgi:chromosome condensin MukBEF complex kleisin-like MukF subunit